MQCCQGLVEVMLESGISVVRVNTKWLNALFVQANLAERTLQINTLSLFNDQENLL